MSLIKCCPLLPVTDEEVHKVRQFYDIDDVTKIRESLKMIREWFEKQEHLKVAYEHLDDDILERLLLLSRGSVETAKIKLDKLFTARGLVPELCMNRNFKEFTKLKQAIQVIVLPHLNPTDQARLIIIKLTSSDTEHFDILSLVRYLLLIGDYRLHYDYNLSDKFIVDFECISTKHLTKLNPIIIKKTQILWTEGYGAKISGIHIVNASSFVDKLVFILKQSLKDKVAKRLYIHQSMEDLGKHVVREVLPKEYGGDLPTVDSLLEQWEALLQTEDSEKIFRDADKLVSDEMKRNSCKFNEEHLGMPGSFRQLYVD